MASPWIPVSPGELLDKISILRLKAERLTEPTKQANVMRELSLLENVAAADIQETPELSALVQELADVNSRLWEIEDVLRSHEVTRNFGESFVENARQVYICNDRRALLKRRVNLLLGSDILEEKGYDAGD